MTFFRYKAISHEGANVNGVIEAYDEFDAVEKIKQSCDIVTQIEQVEQRDVDGPKDLFANRKVKEKLLAMVCSQFSIILSAGLPLVRTVQLIADQTADKTLKKILTSVASDVASGHSLSQSIESNGKQLPTTFIETIRAGEKSGTLETSFKKLQTYYERTAGVKSKVVSALTYPIMLLVVSIAVIALIMIKAVPVFVTMFEGMGSALPLPTRILIGLSNFFENYALIMLFAIAAIGIGIKVYSVTEKGRTNLARFKLKIPLFGKVSIMKASSQFANTMSTMLTAGLPMNKAVEVTGKVLDNYLLGAQVSLAVAGIEEGKRLGDCLRRSEFFPNLLVEMTAVGEESGSMEHTLDVIGAFYDSEVETVTARVVKLIEPIIVCFLAVFVVLILLAVYLPMFSMYSSV